MIKFTCMSYNDKVEDYLTYIFSTFQNIKIDPTFFSNTLDKKIRNLINSFKKEPYKRHDYIFNLLMLGKTTTDQ